MLKARGFTLLEVMMALAVLSISGLALLMVTRENLDNSYHLSQKRPAYWVAENTLTNIRLQRQWPPKQWHKETQTLADREWEVKTRSVRTESDDFRQVEVEVRLSQFPDSAPLAQLQTYLLRQ